jgi:DNA-directed RNA polymerase subunit beta
MVHELQALALDVRMMDDDGNEMDLKQMEQEELKEETSLDMSHQSYVNDAESEGSLTIKEGLEDDEAPEAAVVLSLQHLSFALFC